MADSYESTTIGDFLETLSSDAPAPGGGSVAALSGAMAAALVCMVCNLTIGKEKFAAQENEIIAIRDKATQLREDLVKAIAKDIDAYNQVIACYKLPKNTTQDKIERQEAMQASLKRANEVPYESAKLCYDVLKLDEALPAIGNPNAVSDVAVSAQLAEAGLQSALYNVDINCNYIKDDDYTNLYRKKRAKLSNDASKLKEEILVEVQSMLAK
jgi:formiminotetrahydrofolate cyclodeaminase